MKNVRCFLQMLFLLALCGCPQKEELPQPTGEEALRTLPYLVDVPAEDSRVGTVTFDRARVATGLNLLVSENGRGAILMDLNGKVVHRWHLPDSVSILHTVELAQDGALLAIYGRRFANGFDTQESEVPKAFGLIKLSWNSDELWRLQGFFSHDLDVDENGHVFAIRSKVLQQGYPGVTGMAWEQIIQEISPQGKPLREIPLTPSFKPYIGAAEVAFANQEAEVKGDLVHLNSFEIIKQTRGVASKGDWLVSARNLNLVAVVEAETRKVKWSWGPGTIVMQHQPELLADGHLLLFDNRGFQGSSRVLEWSPSEDRIVWQYPDHPGQLYSEIRGGVQRLHNGNTLIVESDRGRLLEITPAGEVVWEYFTPVRPREPQLRMAPYRVRRLSPEEATPLRGASRGGPS